nr:Uncharacterised protein [Streptococcus thermophilus]
MMLEEYGVVPVSMSPVDAKKELRKSLSDWRLAQAQAVIRDTPLLALDFFEDEGFQVVADRRSTTEIWIRVTTSAIGPKSSPSSDLSVFTP